VKLAIVYCGERDFTRRKQPCGTRCDRIEDRLHIRCRTADDVQHIGGCNLVFERFLQLAGLRLHLLEQMDVADGDYGLIGEGLQAGRSVCR